MALRIKEIAKAKGITMGEIADKMGINPVNLSASLNGNPTLNRLQEVAAILGVEVSDLFAQNISDINGYIETGDNIYPIKSREQFIDILYKIEGIAQIPLTRREDICKNEIKKFVTHSLIEKENGAMMARNNINQVFSLSFDAGSSKFSLTQCINKGEIRFKIIDTTEYLKNDKVTSTVLNQVLEAIHSEIDFNSGPM